jgi:hypothetical protein
MKEITLTQGKVALVDDDIYDYINQWKWHFHPGSGRGRCYARRRAGKHRVLMHRVIFESVMSIPFCFDVDHIDCDGLNNSFSNLRLATRSHNNANGRKRLSCSSSYKGVNWLKSRGKWRVRVKHFHIGCFVNEIDAARAYDEAAKKYFGEYARLNGV